MTSDTAGLEHVIFLAINEWTDKTDSTAVQMLKDFAQRLKAAENVWPIYSEYSRSELKQEVCVFAVEDADSKQFGNSFHRLPSPSSNLGLII